MITTVTLNTSVDKLYLVDHLEDDTVMRVKEVCNTAGGKGLNVSKVAAQLGQSVTALGFIGGYNGEYVNALLEKAGVSPLFTRIEAETRSCINVRDLSTGKHTEFLEPGAAVGEEALKRFWMTYQQVLPRSDVITISGSVPSGVPAGFYGRLIAAAKAQDKPVLLDTSGTLLEENIQEKPTLIKPNRDEIEQLLGTKISTEKELLAAAGKLRDAGVSMVAISLGEDGALLACGQGVYRGKPPVIPVVNTVGCGDSMIAGFAAAMERKLPAEEMLRLAVAVSAANALTIQTGSFEQEDFTRLLPQVRVEKLSDY